MIKRTQVLNIFVSEQLQGAALTLPTLCTCTVAFEYDDTVCCCRRDEGGAVAEARPATDGVEGDVAQAVAEGAEQERHMPAEPRELQSTFRSEVSRFSSSAMAVDSYVCASFINRAVRGSDGFAWVGAIVAGYEVFVVVVAVLGVCLEVAIGKSDHKQTRSTRQDRGGCEDWSAVGR